jgi:hypothetical protein
MDIERKKNILFMAGCDTHKCIENQRDTDLEVIRNDKYCKLMEECIVDIYKILEKFDIKSVDKLKSKIKTLEAKITVLEQSNRDDNSTLIN